jgi:hypothetical protein
MTGNHLTRRCFARATLVTAGTALAATNLRTSTAAADPAGAPERIFEPPGTLSDFARIDGQSRQWHDTISAWTDEIITDVEQFLLAPGERCQYYNWAAAGTAPDTRVQAIVWNGLPNVLVRRFGYDRALELADGFFPLTERADRPGSYFSGPGWSDLRYRPQDEYCEWRVFRDGRGAIRRIVFTAEPPEYWQALHGDELSSAIWDSPKKYPFTGDKQLLVDLYCTYVDERVRHEDLIAHEDMVDHSDPEHPTVVIPKGAYNPWNRWNTTDGLMHLNHPANTIQAQIRLAAEATVLRSRGGRPVTDPDALVCCAGFGGPLRNSDPTIGSTVNVLARAGASLTLRNPVGLYLNDIDLTGITTPDGRPIGREYFRVERGSAEQHMVERAVFEVPEEERGRDGRRLTVSDLRIGGVPIRYGGQVAERITVAMFAMAGARDGAPNTAVGCARRCCQSTENGRYLQLVRLGSPNEEGMVSAFDYPAEPDRRTRSGESARATGRNHRGH